MGAIADRVHSAKTAADDAQRAYQRAQLERRPVVLMLPIDIQPQPAAQTEPTRDPAPQSAPPQPAQSAVEAIADAIARSERPAIIAGRGAVLADAGPDLRRLGERIGAVLATSAPANGLFAGDDYALGISGGFASPFAAEIIPQADLYLVFGASINHWTTKHGALINPDAKLVQIDIEPQGDRAQPAGRHRRGGGREGDRCRPDRRMRGARRAFAPATSQSRSAPGVGTASPTTTRRPTNSSTRARSASRSTGRCRAARQVAVDSGHFLGYPAMFLDVPDARSWVFPNGFQAVGLGLGNAIGAAIATPDKTTVAAIGDGGAFMALPELETAARLKLGNLLVLIYDDMAYGAEVHHFAPMGHDVSRVRFPDADLAAIAAAAGARAATVRTTEDLIAIDDWLAEQSGHPLVLDAKVNPTICAEWLEEAFRAG